MCAENAISAWRRDQIPPTGGTYPPAEEQAVSSQNRRTSCLPVNRFHDQAIRWPTGPGLRIIDIALTTVIERPYRRSDHLGTPGMRSSATITPGSTRYCFPPDSMMAYTGTPSLQAWHSARSAKGRDNSKSSVRPPEKNDPASRRDGESCITRGPFSVKLFRPSALANCQEAHVSP